EMAARYGGEEFALLLPHTEESEAYALARRICHAVRELGIPHTNSTAAPCVTISIGVASAANVSTSANGEGARSNAGAEEQRSGPLVLVQAADQALYASKTSGRNRASCHGIVLDATERSAA